VAPPRSLDGACARVPKLTHGLLMVDQLNKALVALV
jgi:hypothetical protein